MESVSLAVGWGETHPQLVEDSLRPPGSQFSREALESYLSCLLQTAFSSELPGGFGVPPII